MSSKLKLIFVILIFNAGSELFGQELFSITDYYPFAHQNEWRYTAPEGWKDGDYISKIVKIENQFKALFIDIVRENGAALFQLAENAKTFRHFDATKASKLLSVDQKGIFYHGETFSSDGSIAVFEKPIHWFNSDEEIGSKLNVKRNYNRFYADGTQQKGVFTLVQEIRKVENVNVPAGDFKDCLRIEFDTYWDLGKGMEAKSKNVYHHAKGVGVVKASARFIVLKNGIEIINRLVVPELRTYQLN